MRPRVFPAEDPPRKVRGKDLAPASMRPRVFPAEDVHRCGPDWAARWRFNEAAGIPRGRLVDLDVPVGLVRASMRPRVFPAEDATRLGKFPSDSFLLQ